ncbi:hypothetical protein CPB83DRAFT_911268 [Crepidotus variabilis]|uniref:Uncharacterized protein n=1 Tax=Crepidotus variabilis TaxID=179855 RepID=A0A9P6JJ11_9AGAR|nr:hypothetical protein CPB83DRAFT_911268 [Crepidotus variabilis]
MLKVLQLVFVILIVFYPTSLASPNSFNIDNKKPRNVAVSPSPESSSAIGSKQLTNAVRLARGLPPRAPQFRRFLPGIRPRTSNASAPDPGPATVSGVIQITRFDDDGEFVGYVSRELHAIPGSAANSQTLAITTKLSTALTAKLTPTDSLFEITALDGLNPSYPFLGGAATSATSVDLVSGSPNFVYITGSSSTDVGPPTVVGNSYGSVPSESPIWNYDKSTREITATWINADKTSAPTYLSALPMANSTSLVLIGDPAAFNATYPGSYQLKFTLTTFK